MNGRPYDPLTPLDSSFLSLESRNSHMHVAGVAIFDAEPLTTPDGGVDMDRIRQFIAAKLHMVPRYRQHLSYTAIENRPVWVDDRHFNIDYHVRHTSLPRPGTDEQLKLLAGRVVSQQLDRSKPLWEVWIAEGLEGNRFAMIGKVHHSMIDGIAGVDLLAVLLNLQPTSEIPEAPPFEPRPEPSPTELAVRESARRMGKALATLRGTRQLVSEAQTMAFDVTRRTVAAVNSLRSGWLVPASPTPINPTIGPNRRFDWTELDLDRVKDVKNQTGVTVNDVVLATVAGAVRRFLIDDRHFDVDRVDFRVMAPVSVRAASQRGQLGNQVAMWLVHLPIAEADPLARLESIKAETERLKRTNQALGALTIVQISAGAPSTLVSLGARLAAGGRPFNMTVTNVPGPQFPLYLLEAQLLAQYPLVPLWNNHGIGVALFSYMGKMYWGINADWDAVPDVDRFVAALHDSFDELAKAAAPKPARRRKTATS